MPNHPENTAIAIIAASRLVFAVARDGVLPSLKLGLPRERRSATERRDSLSRVSLPWSPAPFSPPASPSPRLSRRPEFQCRCLRSHLSWSTVVHSEALPQAPLESRSLEQAVPVHRCLLERMGCCSSVLSTAFPVTGENLSCSVFLHSRGLFYFANISVDAPIIMAGVTILALISYFIMPESAWLPRTRLTHFIDSKGAVEGTVEEVSSIDRGEPSTR